MLYVSTNVEVKGIYMRILIKKGNTGQAKHLADESDKPLCEARINASRWRIYEGYIGEFLICKRCEWMRARTKNADEQA